MDEHERAVLDQGGYTRLKKWTSMKHVMIIIALEESFHLEITPSDIPRLSTVDKIVEYLQRQKQSQTKI